MNEKFREEAFKRLEQMGLTKKDLFIREKALHKFIRVDFIIVV